MISDEPLIISIGGGKGGVGKSMVSSNLAVHYAQAGMKTILIDLDFGAANLHTLFGIRNPEKGLGEYFCTPRSQLADYLTETKQENLLLGAGSGFVPELANLQHLKKVKLVKQIKELEADLVILDLGAGSANNVIDFFAMTQAGIVVSTPEPTAIVNAYEFLKNVIYRILFRMFRNQPEILDIIKISTLPNNTFGINTISDLIAKIEEQNKWVAENIREVCRELDFYIVLNMARRTSDARLGIRLRDICQKYLCIDLNYAGIVYHNEEVPSAVLKMSPLTMHNPESVTSGTLKRIAVEVFRQLTHKILTGENQEDFDTQYQRVQKVCHEDYTENLLTQRRLQRRREKETPTPAIVEDA